MLIFIEHWLYTNKYSWWVISNIVMPIHAIAVWARFGFNRDKAQAYFEEKLRKAQWRLNKRKGNIERLKCKNQN